MSDPRLESYARLLVERCVDVQPGWQILIRSTPIARPLIEEVERAIARRGAYAVLQLTFGQLQFERWAEQAPERLIGELPPIARFALERAEGVISIDAPENTRDGSDLSGERHALLRRAHRPLLERAMAGDLAWVRCQFPCPAIAQDAGMTVRAFEDFLYGACLLDWDEEGRKMRRIAERFDAATEVRVVGDRTDLTLSLAGREGIVDDGHNNMPGGEVFYSPVEDSAEGVITFGEFPAVHQGREVEQARLVFRAGRVVEASADRGEEILLKTLDTDEGARRIGELGIGCNPGIRRHMRNTLFDEKMDGTIHVAVGSGIPVAGGTNESVVHWDIVKDVRGEGRILCDGEVVQENGEWRF